jgi:CheY-like chemotaxis protein
MKEDPSRILIVEDSKADIFLIREAIAAAKIKADVQEIHDGHQAVHFIDAADREPDALCPDLILLDLNLPKKDGTAVLRHIRDSNACRNARVLIVSSSDSASDREAIVALGVDGYFRKPSVYAEFLKLGVIVRELLARA